MAAPAERRMVLITLVLLGGTRTKPTPRPDGGFLQNRPSIRDRTDFREDASLHPNRPPRRREHRCRRRGGVTCEGRHRTRGVSKGIYHAWPSFAAARMHLGRSCCPPRMTAVRP